MSRHFPTRHSTDKVRLRLCDEGSAFWLGRLCIRLLLGRADRLASASIYSTATPPLLPLHQDLMSYFATKEPMDLIELVSLTGSWVAGTSGDIGEVSSMRNATVAGAARVLLRWAFPEDDVGSYPSPPESDSSQSPPQQNGHPEYLRTASTTAALRLAKMSIEPLIQLTLELLGDRTIVKPHESALALGGGLMMSKGYRGLLLDGLRKHGVSWGLVQVVDDAAGVGAFSLGKVEFGA